MMCFTELFGNIYREIVAVKQNLERRISMGFLRRIFSALRSGFGQSNEDSSSSDANPNKAKITDAEWTVLETALDKAFDGMFGGPIGE
ncbi:hypothetical protein KKC00_01150 [Patescibacteria group bacterium]|nr:hypothetical protein [Patescibacteria group bacterium]